MLPEKPDREYAPELPDIRVQVQVTHLTAHSGAERQVFTYLIRIENHDDLSWQLLARHWEIVDGHGQRILVDGQGVVGQQPIIPPGGVYEYDSFVTLEATPGRMSGYYVMQDAWGRRAQVNIPPFTLGNPGERVLH